MAAISCRQERNAETKPPLLKFNEESSNKTPILLVELRENHTVWYNISSSATNRYLEQVARPISRELDRIIKNYKNFCTREFRQPAYFIRIYHNIESEELSQVLEILKINEVESFQFSTPAREVTNTRSVINELTEL